MYGLRCMALSLGVVLSVAAAVAQAAVKTDAEIDQTFTYSDPKAKNVTVAGEFSNWSELPMARDDSGKWSRTVHLKPGYYGYKYVVDGDWILDPGNSARKTVDGLEDSAMSVGGVRAVADGVASANKIPVTFSFTDAHATSVLLAGEFNNWADNEDGKVTGHTEWLLKGDGSGNWTLTVPMALGKFKFKYVIDGGARWETDPKMPVATDGNSVIEVQGMASAPAPVGSGGAAFTYADATAKSVFVAGEFNQWSAIANPMQKDASGTWTAAIPLKPGKYQYKFVVDGNWKQDAANADAADDTYGGKNSVKTVGP